MQSANDELLDASIAHAIDQQGYSNNVVRRMLSILNKADADLFAKLTVAIESKPNSLTVARLEALLKSVHELNSDVYKHIYGELSTELESLTEYEGTYQLNLFKATVPVELSFASIATSQVYAAAMARPFQGRILSEWADSLEAARLQRIKDAIAIGYVENETTDQIVRRIRGTRALQYKDGLIDIDRRHLESVVRTALNHTSSFARSKMYEANAEFIKAEKWTSVLDARTSEICQARDGKLYQVGQGPYPPAHFNCRSVRVPVVKSFKELGLDENEFPASTRASMDGQVPDDTTYQAWLKKKPAEFQDEVLGVTKGKLFRAGEITLDRFVSRQGHVYSLDELRKRDSLAFERAGL
jgi:SPP1 gp7 family putative phage head morphogenesis protein